MHNASPTGHRAEASSTKQRIRGRRFGIYSPRARAIAFISFLVLVFALGGGSRADIYSLIVLRPLAALFLAYALAGLGAEAWRDIRLPFLLLLGLAALMVLQLVPLPPSLWTALPARAGIAAMDEALGMGDLWRPLSLAPSKTWNSLFSLLVPAAALALFALQDEATRKLAWPVLLGLAVTSAIIGMLQVLGGEGGPFYFYSITNSRFAVGLFSNRNHQGVFLAAMIVTAAWWFASTRRGDRLAGLTAASAIAAMILFVPLIFLAGSRAGLICAVLAVLPALYMMAQAPLVPARIRLGRRLALSRHVVLGAIAAGFTALAVLVVVSSRALALDRLLGDDPFEGMRAQIAPVLLQMIRDHYVFGAGFGAFEHAYRIYEPVDLLGPKYLNNAHNDWAQLVIEGGLPAVVLLLALVWLLLARAWKAWAAPGGEARLRRLMAAAVVALLGCGSLVDYPLRTPSLMALLAIACATLMARPAGAPAPTAARGQP